MTTAMESSRHTSRDLLDSMARTIGYRFTVTSWSIPLAVGALQHCVLTLLRADSIFLQ
jgi:hypothetical protein